MTFTQAELKLIARGLEAVHRQGSRAAKRRKDPFPPGTVQDMYGQEADWVEEITYGLALDNHVRGGCYG
jgi:hypothetical protein